MLLQEYIWTIKSQKKMLILRSVRQGDPISPKTFTATIQEVFKNAQLEEKRINRGFPTRMVYLYYISCLRYTILAGNPRNKDGEKLSNRRFANEVALRTEDVRDTEHQLMTMNEESLKLVSRYIKEKLYF